MEQNQNLKCSGNCLNCLPAQRAYCASQHAYSNMKVLDKIMGVVISMQGDIKTLSEKIEAIQNSEESVFAPLSEELTENIPKVGKTTEEKAQSGDGAEIDAPK